MTGGRRKQLGDLGEELAARHLERAGYEVLARNARTRSGELDIIAANATCLVFCEVKTRVARSVSGTASPLLAIGPEKQRRLRLLAREWLPLHAHRHGRRPDVRFDAIGVAVTSSGRLMALEHLEDAFR
jgi:putative endonuclease